MLEGKNSHNEAWEAILIALPYKKRGCSAFCRKDYSSAIENFTKAIKLYENAKPDLNLKRNPWCKSRMPEMYSCYSWRAIAYFKAGNYDAAIEESKRILKDGDDAFFYALCAFSYLEKGNCKAAVENCDKALEKLSQKEWNCLWNSAQGQYEETQKKRSEAEIKEIWDLRKEIGKMLVRCEKKV